MKKPVKKSVKKAAKTVLKSTQKTALVTGSAHRLGREIALRLADEGYFTFVHYRTSRREGEAVLQTLQKRGGQGALVAGKMDSPADIQGMVAEVKRQTGRMDVLVNNVGVYKPGSLLDYSPEDFEATLRINLSGCFRLIQASLPLFPAAGGSVINIGYAGIENITATTHNTAYLISKSGLFILTKSLAQALGPRHIRVNMVSPGILSNSVELPSDPSTWIPLNRLGKTEDIADAVAFLVGKNADYITGVNLDISGGYHLGLRSLETNRAPHPRRKSQTSPKRT
jgi:3-oxoacyl-[acyl-carrier protein] reductase